MAIKSISRPSPLRYAKAQESIVKALKNLQPQCASRNPKLPTPNNIEKAFENIVHTQEDFILQRQRLRSKLNNFSTYKETLSPLESSVHKKYSLIQIISPSNSPRRCSIPKIQRKSPSERYSIINLEKVSGVDYVVKNCEDFKEKNKVFSKDLPVLQRFVSKSYKKIYKALNVFNGESSSKRSCKMFKKRLLEGFYDVPKRLKRSYEGVM
ncbi:hypothetical protein SteCoe_28499 [Stentor coeruleus]|uniref:Uncharacterized protein n=1 Tax=Stentor coeruleus TaxID=5963 RepID=A0A1R2B840_9CILI|nr:hypothetical protein SteCoe_28499 [Stentor coeruleus]